MQIITFKEAKQKAKYGHREWVIFKKGDVEFGAPVSRDSIKETLLASGTQGRWFIVGGDGVLSKGWWWLGLNMIRNAKYGRVA